MPDDVSDLAWQLRSGTLTLKGGRVEYCSFLAAAGAPEVVATIQRRVDAINAIIEAEGLTPRSIANLADYFTAKENT
jgi:hypothetical protein